jgi:hypothetical protein
MIRPLRWLDNRAWLKKGPLGRWTSTNWTPWQNWGRYLADRLFDGLLLRAGAAVLAFVVLRLLEVL